MESARGYCIEKLKKKIGVSVVRYRVNIRGVVQGVGFRPFVFREAARLALSGFVLNTGSGVTVEIEGALADCDAFFTALRTCAPPLSRVQKIDILALPTTGESGFVIMQSGGGEKRALISPDIGICEDCKRELFTKTDRRYRYPFIN